VRMPPKRIDQIAHELNIATLFVDYVVREERIAATGLRSGNADVGEPDNVYLVGGHEHGVELVDCWRTGDDAKIVWDMGRAALHRGERTHFMASSSDPPKLDELLTHPSGNVLAAIAERRMRETVKAYGIPTSLILNASQTIAPLEDSRNGAWLVAQIRKPARYPFAAVYLCLAPSSRENPRRFFRLP
jgi:hypothetical protein